MFSTHYLEEADDNADRIVVIDQGRIVADGPGERIKRAAGGSLVSFDLAGACRPRASRCCPAWPPWRSDGDRARLRTDDSDATVVALAVQGAVRRLEVAPASLEDAFLSLTARESETV